MNGYYGYTESDDQALIKVYDSVKHTEISEEFILPDYLPDIKRIIKVDTRAKIDGKFVSVGRIDYEGDVISHVLYCDEGNHLKSVTFTAAFKDGLGISEIRDECIANLLPRTEGVICKALNPRRVSLRLRVDTDSTVWCRKSFVPELMGDYDQTEKRSRDIKVMKLICAGEGALNVSCDLEADGSMPQIGEVVSCNTELSFYECKGADGKVLCRGEMPITVFYSSNTGETQSYSVLCRKLPVAQVVTADGVDESYTCMARGTVDAVKINVVDNGFGERRIIELDVTYRIYLNCVGSTTVNVTEDIYAVGKNVTSEIEKECFCRFSRLYTSSIAANSVISREELNLTGVENVFAISAEPKITGVVKDERSGNVKISGEARAVAMIKTDETIATREYTVPINYEVDGSGVPNDFIYNYDITCMGAKGRLDSESFYTELELQLSLMILEAEEAEVLKKAVFSPLPDLEPRPQMRFYYPSEGEDIWSIGKSLGVSVAELMEKNDVKDNLIPNVLFIPY